MRPAFPFLFRGIRQLFHSPWSLLMGLGTSIFFLVVYQAGMGGIDYLKAFEGLDYMTFLYPLGLLSLAMGTASGAGPSLASDIESGYFQRLFLSPLPRWLFGFGPILADGLGTLLASLLLLGLGVLFGLSFHFGLSSLLGLLALSSLWGLFLSGLSGTVMLLSRDAGGARAVTSLAFPLVFLTETFLPREMIRSSWLLVVSRFNPLTPMMRAMRFLLGGMGEARQVILAFALMVPMALVSVLLACWAAHRLES